MRRAVRTVNGKTVWEAVGPTDKRGWRLKDDVPPHSNRWPMARARTPRRVPNARRQESGQGTEARKNRHKHT